MKLSIEALKVIHKRNSEEWPDKTPVIEMSIELAEALMHSYNERRGNGPYIDMTAMEFQAAVMVREFEKAT